MALVVNADSESPLPAGWSQPEAFRETVSVGDLRIALAGFVAHHEGGKAATGSAAALTQAPVMRAGYELRERVAVLERWLKPEAEIPFRTASGRDLGTVPWDRVFPESPSDASWRYAMSSGVAIHRSWNAAASRAFLEAAERDAILRSWFGGRRPLPMAMVNSRLLETLKPLYEVHCVVFPSRGEERVCGLFGFPMSPSSPLLMGFGAGYSFAEAWDACERESLQRLGFLWGETIPGEEPKLAKDALSQQEYYLWPGSHGRLRAWLAGHHEAQDTAVPLPPHNMTFADITPPLYEGKFAVAKAIDASTTPLVFGSGHPMFSQSPESMRVQPIA